MMNYFNTYVKSKWIDSNQYSGNESAQRVFGHIAQVYFGWAVRAVVELSFVLSCQFCIIYDVMCYFSTVVHYTQIKYCSLLTVAVESWVKSRSSTSPMEQSELEASPDLLHSPHILVDLGVSDPNADFLTIDSRLGDQTKEERTMIVRSPEK